MKFHHDLTEKLEKHTIPHPSIAFTKHYTKHYTTILSHTLPWIESSYVQIYVQPGVDTAYAHEYIHIHTSWTLVLQHVHMYSKHTLDALSIIQYIPKVLSCYCACVHCKHCIPSQTGGTLNKDKLEIYVHLRILKTEWLGYIHVCMYVLYMHLQHVAIHSYASTQYSYSGVVQGSRRTVITKATGLKVKGS